MNCLALPLGIERRKKNKKKMKEVMNDDGVGRERKERKEIFFFKEI